MKLANAEPDIEVRLQVAQVVGRLSHRQQQAIRLCFWEGMTQEEAAAQMACDQVTVSRALGAAISRLKTLLHKSHAPNR